jgi:glutamine synthetase
MASDTELGDERARPRADTLVEALVAADVAIVALTYVDNSGIGRVKGVPVGRFADAAVWGVGMSPVFDAFVLDDSITASPSAGGPVGDLRLVPDLDQLVVLAAQPGWAWTPVDRWGQSGDRHPQCQRELVRRMVRQLAERGLEALMAFELEWMLSTAEGDEFESATAGPAYGLTRTIELSDYSVELVNTLEAHGIPVEQFHPEYAAGQFELSIPAADPLTAADRNVLTRQVIKAVSARHGMRTTFAPSVVAGGVGNGMHLHMSLWRDGHNESTDGTGPLGVSSTTESFLAGVLDSLPDLLAVTAPSVASYLRLQPQRWAGPYRCWGLENREAAVRLITGPEGRQATAANAELKVVDASASPYLAIGAVLAAGLAGLDTGATLPEPVEVDPATLDADALAARGVERLPASLDDAVDRFERSEVMRSGLGSSLHETIVAVRRAECALFAGATDDEVVAATRWRH